MKNLVFILICCTIPFSAFSQNYGPDKNADTTYKHESFQNIGTKEEPADASEDYKYATLYFEKENYKNAIIYYTAGIQKDPKHIPSYYHRGISYKKTGKLELACADWKKAKELGDKEAEKLITKYCKD